jgi:hypothetical protein
MQLKPRIIVLAVLLSCTAGTKTFAAEHLQVIVQNISEYRNNEHPRVNSCELKLCFSGNAVAESLGILNVRILSAENDLGEDIAPIQTPNRSVPFPREPVAEVDHEKKSTKTIQLKPSSRKAATISLRGEVDLYQPDLVPHSRVVLTNFILNPNTWLESPGLSKADVKIMFVGRENFESFTRMWREKQLGAHMISSSLAGQGDVKNALRFHIEDPGYRVVKLDLQDAAGVSQRPWAVMLSEKYRLLGFPNRPASDVQLVLYLDDPDAKRTLAFRLEKIPLP